MTQDSMEKSAKSRSPVLAVLASTAALVVLAVVVLQGLKSEQSAPTSVETGGPHISEVPPDDAVYRKGEILSWALNALHEAIDANDKETHATRLEQFMPSDVANQVLQSPLTAHGLEDTAEGFHEVEVLSWGSTGGGRSFTMTAQWRTVGLLEGEEHLHRIGYVFSGEVEFSWQQSEWRLTQIVVTDVDRSRVGQIVKTEP